MSNTEEKTNQIFNTGMENVNSGDNNTLKVDLFFLDANETRDEKIIGTKNQTEIKNNQTIENTENEGIEEESYSHLDKESLLAKLSESNILLDGEPEKRKVKKITAAYIEISNLDNETKLAKFLEQGGLKEDYEIIQDPIDHEFFEKLKKFNQKLTEQRKLKEKTLRENYAKKQELIDELKKLIESGENLNIVFEKYQQIQSNWRSIGLVPNNLMNTQRQDFQFHVGRFFDLVKISKELRELDLKKNKELKLDLIIKAENLINEPSINLSIEVFRQIQLDWQNIGQAEKEINDEIWNRLKMAGNVLFERKEKHIKELRIIQDENISKKRTLVNSLKDILESPKKSVQSWSEADTKIDALMIEWKKIGFGPKKENEEIWQEFRKLRQSYFEEKDRYYEALKITQTENLKKKTSLCEEAEGLKDSIDWDLTTKKLITLQEQWKKIGNVPRKYSDQIWNRFRAACNIFFESKKMYLTTKEDELKGNILIKEDIISRIESFTPNEDLNMALQVLSNLQKEFHQIEIPNSDKSRIGSLYQKAINKVLENFKNEENSGLKYFELKYKLISQTEKGKDQIIQESNRIQEKIKVLESEVGLLENNIGFFGKSKGSQKMVEEFQQKISSIKSISKELKNQLRILKSI